MSVRESEPHREVESERPPPVPGLGPSGTLAQTLLVLQRSAGNRAVGRVLRRRMLARYEAGEHAQLGKTGDELRALVEQNALSYKVKRGETLSSIARRFGLTVAQLEAANPTHLRRWRRAGGGAGTVVGFEAGDVVRIP